MCRSELFEPTAAHDILGASLTLLFCAAQVSNAEAISFYQKFGFKITETIQGEARVRCLARIINS
jgi:ribosomal protein S18 acetylase RimI-like enzyme